MKQSVLTAILVVEAAAAVAANPLDYLSTILSPVLMATGLSAPISVVKVASKKNAVAHAVWSHLVSEAMSLRYSVVMNLLFVLVFTVVEGGVLTRLMDLVVGQLFAATGLALPFAATKGAADAELMKDGLDFAGNLSDFATSLIANTSEHVGHFAKTGLHSTTTLGKKALEGGVKVTKKGLDLAKTVSKHIPGYGRFISAGAHIGLGGLPAVQSVAHKGLDLVNNGGHKAIDLGHKAVKGGAETVNNVTQTGLDLGKNIIHRVNSAKERFTGAVNHYSGGFLFRKPNEHN